MEPRIGLRPALLASFAVLSILAGCNDDEKQPSLMGSSQAMAELQFNTRLLSRFNKYPAQGYSNLWGYTAPDGREYALIGARGGTSIVDITDGANPVESAFIPGPFSNWRELKTHGHYAYVVTEAGGGMQIIDLSNLPVSAELTHTYTGFSRGHTVTVDETRGYLYVGGGEGTSSRALTLADPERPVELGIFDAPEYVHDQSVQGTRGYLAEGSTGMFSIFDLTNPAAPVKLGHWRADEANGHAHEAREGAASPPRINDPGHDDGSGSSGGAGYAHNIWPTTDGLSALTTEETTGKTVKRWDIADPTRVRMTAEYLGPNRLAHNVHVKGRYAYLAHYGSGLRVLDLADPHQLPEVAAYQKAGVQRAGYTGVWGIYPYFRSGKIILSDIEDGLFVVHFEGAVE